MVVIFAVCDAVCDGHYRAQMSAPVHGKGDACMQEVITMMAVVLPSPHISEADLAQGAFELLRVSALTFNAVSLLLNVRLHVSLYIFGEMHDREATLDANTFFAHMVISGLNALLVAIACGFALACVGLRL